MASMRGQPDPLARAAYLSLRGSFVPSKVRTIFVLESPPASGKYFYNPAGSVKEPLFRAMMKDVLGIEPGSKEEGLKEFAARGYLLVDATYTPVNRTKGKARDTIILGALPTLVEELKKYAAVETRLVLVKANVCTLLEPKLKKAGFNILNNGVKIPFPNRFHIRAFRDTIRSVLGTRHI